MASIIIYDPIVLLDKRIPTASIDAYFSALMAENQRVNLVSRETTRADFNRLLAESLLPLETIQQERKTFQPENYLDIGSGGGIPGIPLLMALEGVREAIFLERRGKKAEALKRIISELGLDTRAKPLDQNYDEFQPLGSFDLISMRYVRLTPRLLHRIAGHLTPDGLFVYYATPDFKTTDLHSVIHKFSAPRSEVVKSFTIFAKKP